MSTELPHAATPNVTLARKVAFLSRSESYAARPRHVDRVETHMSWVFLTDEHVYKLKKPLRRPFLDFSTLEARHRNALEEVRLNRRLARDVYLGVVALTTRDGQALELDGAGTPVEWLVKMRRLPQALMLDQAIRDGTVTEASIDRLMDVLAGFYRAAVPVPVSGRAYVQRFERDVNAAQSVLCDTKYALSSDALQPTTHALLAFLAEDAEPLKRRAEARRIIEAHGDLRPEHVCLTDTPVIIDCLEFNRAFRILDPVDELAHLAVECEQLGAALIGERILAAYEDRTGDRADRRLVSFYKAYRATLRAKLAIWHLDDRDARERDKWIERTKEYLALAARHARSL